MRFKSYDDIQSFRRDVLGILLENEILNNIQIGILTAGSKLHTPSWLLGTVLDDDGSILLTAMCTPPFNLLLYETNNRAGNMRARTEAVELLADELRNMDYSPPGVLAERELAHRFAAAYAGGCDYFRHISMSVMRLDTLPDIKKAPGSCRVLRGDDLFFAPYWERAFSEDCRSEIFSIEDNIKRIKERLGKDRHLIWEACGIPVSQAVHGRSTITGAVINSVYTPPHLRGRGYATSVVAELSERLLRGDYKYCCLFADESNPVSRSVYRKIGYCDISVFDELRFKK